MAHPLTKEDLDNINSSLAGIQTAREIAGRAKIAGIDVEAQMLQLDDAEGKLKGIKQGFFPGGRATK